MASAMVTVRNAIETALNGASLPLSPVIEAKWFTTRKKQRGTHDEVALPATAPLITVTIAERGAQRLSDTSYETYGTISIGMRANCATDARADELDDLLEEIINAVWSADWAGNVAPPLEEVVTVIPCDHETLNVSKVWISELHCLIGKRKENA